MFLGNGVWVCRLLAGTAAALVCVRFVTAGVADGVIHAPGGRGVLIAASLAFSVVFKARAGGVRSLSTSSEDDGGSGKSGIPLGGDGVRNSALEIFKTLSRFGVATNPPGNMIEGDGGSKLLSERIGICMSMKRSPDGFTRNSDSLLTKGADSDSWEPSGDIPVGCSSVGFRVPAVASSSKIIRATCQTCP